MNESVISLMRGNLRTNESRGCAVLMTFHGTSATRPTIYGLHPSLSGAVEKNYSEYKTSTLPRPSCDPGIERQAVSWTRRHYCTVTNAKLWVCRTLLEELYDNVHHPREHKKEPETLKHFLERV